MTDQTQTPTSEAPEAPAPSPQEARAAIRDRVAREMFGNDYHPEDRPSQQGLIEETKPADTEAGEETPPIEEPTEGDVPEEGAEEETAPEDSGETPIDHLSELVEHFQLDPEQVNAMKVKVTVDGTPTEATIDQLVRSYQTQQAAENRLNDAKSIAQKESEAWAAKQKEIDAERHVLAALVAHEEQTLSRDIQAVDPNLRHTDPAEWSARMTEFEQRRAHLDGVKNAARAQYDASQQQAAQQAMALRSAFTAEQAQILLQKLPEWQDEAKANAEKQELQRFLLDRGFEHRELSELTDHRHLLLVRDAWLYRQSRDQVDTAKKKVAKVPRIMKPGAPKPAEQRASEKLAALKARMIKTGRVEDATAYQMAKRGVSR